MRDAVPTASSTNKTVVQSSNLYAGGVVSMMNKVGFFRGSLGVLPFPKFNSISWHFIHHYEIQKTKEIKSRTIN